MVYDYEGCGMTFILRFAVCGGRSLLNAAAKHIRVLARLSPSLGLSLELMVVEVNNVEIRISN